MIDDVANDPQYEFSQRHHEFMDLFGGEEFIEDTLIAATHRIADVADAIYGSVAAEKAMNTLVGDCFPSAVRDGGWRHALEEEANGMYSDTSGGALLHDLTAYADYGIVVTPCRDGARREELLEQQVRQGLQLLEMVADRPLDEDSGPVWRVVRKAAARWKLDTGQPIDALELSLLSGLARQSIRNRLAGQSREIEGNRNRIEAHDALAWLEAHRNRDPAKAFRSSIWRSQSETEVAAPFDHTMDKPYFVPVAQDNSIFHPGLARDGVFQIGEAGTEREFETFDEAAAALQKMHVPIWRRPTETGRWRQVRGLNWRRLTRDELELIARRASEPGTSTTAPSEG